MKKGLFITSTILISLFLAVKLKFVAIEPVYFKSEIGLADLIVLFGSVLLLIFLFSRSFQLDYKKIVNRKRTFMTWLFAFLLISTLAISGVFTYSKKSLDWDAVALYDARAKFIQSGLKFSDMISLSTFDDKNKYYYLLYPPFTSIVHTFWYELGISIPVSFIYFIMLCVLVVGIYLFAIDYLGITFTLMFSLLTIANKDVFTTSLIEYTNLPFMLFMVIGIFVLVYFLKTKQKWAIVASAILIGASLWIRYLEPVWICILLALAIYLFKKKSVRENIVLFLFFATFISYQYIAWGYFQNLIASTPKIFFVTPKVILESVLGIFSGAFLNLLIFYIKSIGLIAIVHFVALIKIDKDEPSEFLFLRYVIAISLIMYFIGLYGISFLFDWWGELGGSLVRSSTYLIPVSIFLTIYNVKYILQKEIKINRLKDWQKQLNPLLMKNKYSKNEQKERNHFDLMAKKYDSNYGYDNSFTRFKINKKTMEFKKFVTSKNFKEKPFIVELGCGTGEYTKKIAEFFPKAKILAIDISKEIVNVARLKCKANKNVKFKVASAYTTGLSKNSVDVICGFYFLHHVSLRSVNKEIFRVLKESGSAFFYEPNILNPIVYLIKSNPYLKRWVGDSPDEWAINPLTLYKSFPKMKLSVKISEFVPPLSFLPFKYLKLLDDMTSVFSKLPLIGYLGGSLAIKISK